MNTKFADMTINEIDSFISKSILDAMKDKRDDIANNVEIDTWEQFSSKDPKLVSNFAETFFEFNDYVEGSYNNNWLVEAIHEAYKTDAYRMEYLGYLVYAAAASFINSCYPYTDIEEVTGMGSGYAIIRLRKRLIYKYLTWAFSSPDDSCIEWNLFNKKASMYANTRDGKF